MSHIATRRSYLSRRVRDGGAAIAEWQSRRLEIEITNFGPFNQDRTPGKQNVQQKIPLDHIHPRRTAIMVPRRAADLKSFADVALMQQLENLDEDETAIEQSSGTLSFSNILSFDFLKCWMQNLTMNTWSASDSFLTTP